MKEKKGSRMCCVKTIQESGIIDLKYYRTRSIPAVGYYFREGDAEDKQLSLDIDK
jgi:hypothetical protein